MSTIAKRKFKCRYCSQKFAYFDTWRRHSLQHQEKNKKKEEKAKEKEEKAKLSAPKRKQPAAFRKENQEKDKKKEEEKKAKAKLSASKRKQPAAYKEESCNKDFVQGDASAFVANKDFVQGDASAFVANKDFVQVDASAFEAFLNQGIIDSNLDFLAEDVTNTNGEKQCSIEACILSDCTKDNCIFAQLEEPPVKKRKLSPVGSSSKNTQRDKNVVMEHKKLPLEGSRDKKPRIEHKKLPSGGSKDKKPRVEHKKLPSGGSRAKVQERLSFALYDPFLTKALEVNLNTPSGSDSASAKQKASSTITSENFTNQRQSVSASRTSEYLAKQKQHGSATKEETAKRVSGKQSGLKLFFCMKCNINFRCREDMEMHRDLHAVVKPNSDYF